MFYEHDWNRVSISESIQLLDEYMVTDKLLKVCRRPSKRWEQYGCHANVIRWALLNPGKHIGEAV